MNLDWPLMRENVTRDDTNAVIEFLKQDPLPRLTQSAQVKAFEREWSEWLGVKHSIFVNSGASANLITLATLRERVASGEIIVPTLTWASDIMSILYAGFDPVFVDIDKKTLGMDADDAERKISRKTVAIFLTHVLGFNALSYRLLKLVHDFNLILLEDACESHGTTFAGKKVGTFGLMSNFSFYYAHHMSTIEGGMVSTDDDDLAEWLKIIRGHGLAREASAEVSAKLIRDNRYLRLNSDFIFVRSGYNVRNTEINAVIGRSQLKTLDARNEIRRANMNIFFANLDQDRFVTDLDTGGCFSYAFTPILRLPNIKLRDKIEMLLRDSRVEFRRGLSGGGNQIRQPYIVDYLTRKRKWNPAEFPNTEHVHFYGWYLGNYPDLEQWKILGLCNLLNGA